MGFGRGSHSAKNRYIRTKTKLKTHATSVVFGHEKPRNTFSFGLRLNSTAVVNMCSKNHTAYTWDRAAASDTFHSIVLHINSSLQCSPRSQKVLKPCSLRDPQNRLKKKKTKYRVGRDPENHLKKKNGISGGESTMLSTLFAHETKKAQKVLINLQTELTTTSPPASPQLQHIHSCEPNTSMLVASGGNG